MASYDDVEVKESGLTEREESTLPEWAQERIKNLREVKPPKYVQGGLLDKVTFEVDGKTLYASIKTLAIGADEMTYLDLTSPDSLSVLPRSANSVAIVPRGLIDEKSHPTEST